MTTSADLFNPGWGSPVERERRRRIRLSVWAYAYEMVDHPLVSDTTFDDEARRSVATIRTGLHDDWWQAMFSPHTGLWIYTHPDLAGIIRLYEQSALA